MDFLRESVADTLVAARDTRAPQNMVFADLFAGTGVVGAAFREAGYTVLTNDIQYYSYVLCRHLTENDEKNLPPARADELTARLQAVEGIDGFLYRNYSWGGTEGCEHRRMYFSDENARKCDGMRTALESWRHSGEIDEHEYFFLLASLVNSADKYANTASVYGAYLKQLKASARKSLTLSPLPVVHGAIGKAYNADISALVGQVRGDILYLDPPNNARQYCTNYHLLETIALYDEPVVHGKTGLREYGAQKSVFCHKATVADAFEDLVRRADFRYIFLSYNNEGLMSFQEIERIMSKYGKYKVRLREHRRFKADSARFCKADATVETLHCLIKK